MCRDLIVHSLVPQIWITNLDGAPRDRISACISRCGGVRFDTPHARVTHVVAGSVPGGGREAHQLPSVPVLSPAWVLRSVVAGRVLDEGDVSCIFLK